MAKAKKAASSSKTAKKSVKKSVTSAKSVKKSAKRAGPAATPVRNGAKPKRAVVKSREPALTTDERRRLLKMRDDSDDVAERAVALWSTWRDVRVRGLSPAKLRSLMVKAKNAAQKEAFTESLWEAKMRPLQDARLRAEDAAYRALLDLHAQVKVLGRNDPAVLEAFSFLAEHVSGTRESERADGEEKPVG
ncbi:MAG: hypothetical protein U0269_36350 [Polyangiales bacterium]